jgi:hypothetical protein
MYIYLSSLVKYKNSPRAWAQQNIGNMLISDIIATFEDVYFTFEHTVLTGFQYCFLNDLLSMTLNKDATLVQALNIIDNLFIPTTNVGKNLMSTSVTYADALQTGWSFKTMQPNSHPDTIAIGSQSTDLFLSKDGISADEAGESLLCLVNGMAHFTYSGYNGLVVTGGGRTLRATESNLVSFINLGNLGETNCHLIESDMLHPGTTSMQNETMDGYLELGVNLVNKSLILSIGGLLYFEGDVVNVINREQGFIKLNYHRLDHASLFYEIATHLNPDELGTVLTNIRAGILLKSSIFDPDNLKELLDMAQTFAIVVDTPNIVYEYGSVQDGHLKNVLVSYSLPNKPIKGFSNRLLPYRFKDERGKYSIHVDEYRTPAFMHWTTNQFAVNDYISFGVMRSNEDLSNACVFLDIKTQWFE